MNCINFRDKKPSYNDYSMKIELNNGNIYSKSKNDDPYLKCFLSGLSLRNCCYSCKFKNGFFAADITLGDYWGSRFQSCEEGESVIKSGCSTIGIHTEKGVTFFDSFSNDIVSYCSTFEEVSEHNAGWTHSPKKPLRRSAFIHAILKC